MPELDDIIDEKIGEVRTEAIDISFGEIINLYGSKEFIIQPDYQRLFRWSPEQQSRLIESVLLELPIPQIFVVENEDSVLELVDGLQRISSAIHFIQADLLSDEPLTLSGCDLVAELNGMTFDKLSLRLRLRLKRSSVRMVVIKRQSAFMVRYAMFKRLNTGGEPLEPQEIRNCTARMIGQSGIQFYKFLQECAQNPDFVSCTTTLAEERRDQKADEELVLRFFALKNGRELFQQSVRDWLDDYMEKVILEKVDFGYTAEEQTFRRTFDYINLVMGTGAFVKYRDGRPIGGLAPAYYEAVTMGVLTVMDSLTTVPVEQVKQAIIDAVQSPEFRENIGSAANTRGKLRGRIETVQQALEKLIP